MRHFDSPADILQQTRIVEQFLDCVRFDTRSDEDNPGCPSSPNQLELGRHLVSRLKELGLENASLDQHGYVLAEKRGNAKGAIGLCAHLDTAPGFSGTNVQVRLHEQYDGSPIRLENGVIIDPKDNPELSQCTGDTIITADGTTLLGADDKAGIAAILAMIEVLCADPKIAHPTLKICFNPDEEIGKGTIHFPLESFGAPVAFTVDGGFPGEMNLETFSADRATVTFRGVAVHPGTAKGKMVNALTYMGKFLARLPMAESPECTEDREGFFHPTDISGDAAECQLRLILRDFDSRVLAERGRRLVRMAEAISAEEPKLEVEVDLEQQYRNMHDELARRPEIAQNLERAIRATGLVPRNEPIRGGTDGSALTARGLPTPNIFAGGVNFHGPTEWISTRALALSACTLLNLVQIYAE